MTLPSIFSRLFEWAGKDMEDYVEIEKVEPQWRSFFPDGAIIDLYSDLDRTIKANEEIDEDDGKQIRRFLDYSKKLYENVKDGYFEEGIDNRWELIKYYGPIRLLTSFDYFSTLNQGVERYIGKDHLQDMFDFFIKYVGSSPYDAPAILNLLPYIQIEYGLWYVPGGLYKLSEGLRQLLEDLDVEINLEAEVINLIEENGRIKGLKLKDGTEREGDIFVSNMEVIPAYKNLLDGNEGLVKKYEKKFEPACSGLVIHLGLDKEYSQLEHHNFFFSANPKEHFDSIYHDYELPKDPTIYLVATTKSDQTQAPEAHENIKVLPHIPHLGENDFSEEDYEKLRDRVLSKLEKMGLKDLRDHIVTEDIWTPEDIRDKYYSNEGAIYGVVSDRKKNLGFKAPKSSKIYNNLYFVGGSVNPGGGMPMVVLSGQQVKDMILSKERR
ncbi:MAG: Phytoene dehydrogenase family enzyme [Candidatus Methanohalarchaeum thermophilum]|uniref:Phytoene dehydrogenase family enzyme n=1 Tax=Methanohalarchaeum thermophilum TaxID=1903181 RepID=A0A1Q6DXG7_METT1|nr:MAG: Phytoene dehydrogenase family enzyme [Candidatus Methanohalarchaeum thermophilum]